MKKILISALVFLLMLGLSACTDANNNQEETSLDKKSTYTRVITDALGREVEIPAEINTIVPLGNTPRMIAYLGLADKVVGISGFDANDVSPLTAYAYANKELWTNLPIVGTDSFGNTDYYPEVIISVDPDVILCTYTEDIVKDIETKTNIPVIAVGQGTLFGEDYEQSLRILGEVCGVEERAEELIEYINATLADLNARTADIAEEDRPTVLSAAATFKGTHGIEGVRINDPVLDAINANNIAADSTLGNATVVEIDREQILLWDPDYIFCDYGGVALVQQDAAQNPDYYAQLSAYNNGHIYQYPSSTSYFSNVEIPLANCYFVGSIIYPEQFADIDIEAKANEICAFFLGVDDYMSVLNDYGANYGPVEFGDN